MYNRRIFYLPHQTEGTNASSLHHRSLFQSKENCYIIVATLHDKMIRVFQITITKKTYISGKSWII